MLIFVNRFGGKLTYNNPLKACFKKYILHTIQTHQTQIVKVYFLRFLKVIGVQI